MHKLLFAGAAAIALATPAVAADGTGYIGVDIGAMFAKKNRFDTEIRNVNLANVAVVDNGFSTSYDAGVDADVRGGYDFGMFRFEGEVAYKSAGIKDTTYSTPLLTAISTATGNTVLASDLDDDGRVTVWSGMLNGLLDFGGNDSVGGYVGVGAGIAGVKWTGAVDDRQNGFAWQALAGVYMPVSSNLDIGLRYRYFRTGKLDNLRSDLGYAGPGAYRLDFEDKFSSHSLMASLVYNFAAPPPPPPPPPATQTCPDGSVILATDTCPAPPPPPPPPPPAPERGF